MAVTILVDIDTKELDDFEKLKLKRAQDKAMDRSIDWLAQRGRHYPPVRPSSTYERTYNHQRALITKKTSYRQGGIIWTDQGTVGEYAHWVRSKRMQAGVHRGRWPTDQDIAREAGQKVTGFFDYEIERVAK